MSNERLQSAADDLYAWFKKSVSRNRPADMAAADLKNKEAVQAIGWRHLVNAALSGYDSGEHHGWVSKNKLHDLLSPLGLMYGERYSQDAQTRYHVLAPNTTPLDEGMIFKNSHGNNVVMDLSRPINLTRFMLDFQSYVAAKVNERQQAILNEYLSEEALRLLINSQHLGWRFDRKLEMYMVNSYTVYDPMYCFEQACRQVEVDLQMLARDQLTMLGYDCTLETVNPTHEG